MNFFLSFSFFSYRRFEQGWIMKIEDLTRLMSWSFVFAFDHRPDSRNWNTPLRTHKHHQATENRTDTTLSLPLRV